MSEHISPVDFDRLFPNAARSVREENRKAWEVTQRVRRVLGEPPGEQPVNKPAPVVHAKRIRQSSKPLLNKLETEYAHELANRFVDVKIRPQAKRYRLANGVTYTPDFTAVVNGRETAWEVKGKHSWDDAIVKIKVAPSSWPEIQWFFCWKDKYGWHEQEMLP